MPFGHTSMLAVPRKKRGEAIQVIRTDLLPKISAILASNSVSGRTPDAVIEDIRARTPLKTAFLQSLAAAASDACPSPDFAAIDTARSCYEEKRGAMAVLHRKLIATVVRKFSIREASAVTYDDLFQVGYMGLLRAIDDYDPRYGAFSTHAACHMYAAVQQECASGCHPLHVTKYGEEQWRKAAQADDPKSSMTPPQCFSLDACRSVAARITKDDEHEEQARNVGQLRGAIDALPSREREVLVARLGMHGSPQTFHAIGAQLGVTGVRAAQIFHGALRTLSRFFGADYTIVKTQLFRAINAR